MICERLLPNMVGGVSVSGNMIRAIITFFALFLAVSATAQTVEPETLPDITPEELPVEPVPETEGDESSTPEDDDDFTVLPDVIDPEPDYSRLTPEAERTAKLNRLFERLKDETDAEKADLVAEEIWAIWLDSGSASVNMILRRGTAAEKKADIDLARRMYDHVTNLSPDYAEGWARSARLAYAQDELNRAYHEVKQALILEPRHFYALWTLGNIMEKLGRREAAYEAYQEASKLYPELEALKTRLLFLESELNGDVL